MDFTNGKDNKNLNSNSKKQINDNNNFVLPLLKNTNDFFEDNETDSPKNSNYKFGKNIKLQKNLYPFVLNKNGNINNEEEVFIYNNNFSIYIKCLFDNFEFF